MLLKSLTSSFKKRFSINASLYAVLTVGLLLSACNSASTTGGDKPLEPAEEISSQHPPTGGMWMPEQIPALKKILSKLGLAIDPAELSDPTSSTLNAIVSLGGCSGSFLSKEGLIITNHHCVNRYLNYMTQIDRQNGNADVDYNRDGYYAPTRDKERFTGPESRVFITLEIKDVTDKMTAGIADIADPLLRTQELEKRQKALVKEAEASGANIKADLSSFFKGEKYYLTKKLELKDLRLVYAPPESIGFFGGDEKNWEFPRHVGDFAFLRIYKGEGDNIEPADTNKPFTPKNIMKVATAPTRDGDLVLVAGYPGRTNRLSTYEESQDDFNEVLPYEIELLTDAKKLFDELSERSEVLKSKTASTRFGINNYYKNKIEAQKALTEIKYLDGKKKLQADLSKWINSTPELKVQFGEALTSVEAVRQKYKAGWTQRSEVLRPFHRSYNPLFNAALTITRLAKEKQKADIDRLPDYQERNWKALRDRVKGVQASYDRILAVEAMAHFVAVVLKHPTLPAYIQESYNLVGVTESSLKTQTEAMLAASELEDLEKRLKLFDNATFAELQASNDPLIKISLKALSTVEEVENHEKKLSGEMTTTVGAYIKALRGFLATREQEMAPDANSTLRVTFGKVEGYFSKKLQRQLPAYTNFKQLLEEEYKPGKEYFELPQSWLDAYEKVKEHGYGKYADNGELPLNFVANVDTTGGNSGSAAMNSKGEIIGLLFDGNSENLYSDYRFDKNVRSILVDVRYAMWTLDQIVGAKDLLLEIGITPDFAQ